MPRAGLLFDIDTGRVLWRHQPTRVLPIASLTKMMTALMVADRLGPRTRVPITREALHYQGSGVGLLPRGKRIRTETMLYGLMLPSGNDAAIALAQRAAGTRAEVRRRDERARASGWGCSARASPPRTASRTAATTRAPATSPRSPARCCACRGWRGSCASREAVLPFPIKGGKLYLYNNNPLLRQGYRGDHGHEDRLHRRRRPLPGRHRAPRRRSSSASCCCTRPTRPGRRAGCWTAGSRVGGASSRARGRRETTRSSWIARRPRRARAKRTPSISTSSPSSGSRPRCSSTTPPIVASWWSSNSTPRRSSTSRTGAQPAITVPLGLLAHRLALLGVELVLDLAHDLLEDVLERDQPDHGAVLVDDEREVLAQLAQALEQLVDQHRLRDALERRARCPPATSVPAARAGP